MCTLKFLPWVLPQGHCLSCAFPFPQKEFQFLQQATLDTVASQSSHILTAGRRVLSSLTYPSYLSNSTHITSSQKPHDVPTLPHHTDSRLMRTSPVCLLLGLLASLPHLSPQH